MKKLNNKGITTIEVIICFILIATISTAMYSTVSAFNEKRIIEQYKEEIYTYKNILTKTIQDDFIKIGITSATSKMSTSAGKAIYSVNCVMKDGTKRQLIIIQQNAKSPTHPDGSESVDDYYMIEYGPTNEFIDITKPTLDTSPDVMEYPIPKLGSTTLDKGTSKERVVQDLSLINTKIDITNSVLNVYIGFNHPELSNRYGIQIISPINYQATGGESDSKFHLYNH